MNTLDRNEAAMLASAAGDALGWPQSWPAQEPPPRGAEHYPWVRRARVRQTETYEEEVKAGSYSSNTQLMLATARSLCWPKPENVFARTELPLWIVYARGGRATERAAHTWARGDPPWRGDASSVNKYMRSDDSGIAARVLPYAIWHASHDSPVPMLTQVVRHGMLTHGHPRALLSAKLYAYSCWALLRARLTCAPSALPAMLRSARTQWDALPVGNSMIDILVDCDKNYEKLWQEAANELCELLHLASDPSIRKNPDTMLQRMGCDGSKRGPGTAVVAAAIYLISHYGADPVQAIVEAAFSGHTDADMLAALCGGLAGCATAPGWVPSAWGCVQDFGYICGMARRIGRHQMYDGNQPRKIGYPELSKIRAVLANTGQHVIPWDGVRHVVTCDYNEPDTPMKLVPIRSWGLRATDGQTFYVTV